jgi:ParB family chromosome partitioning protein
MAAREKSARKNARKQPAKTAKQARKQRRGETTPAGAARRRSASRKNLKPAAKRRGLRADQVALAIDDPEIQALVGEIRAVGGAPIGPYREPLSGRPLLLAAVPIGAIEPTPFQRDLSPTHTKRLAQKIEESGFFLDPLIAVRGASGGLWTPNGRHRLAAAKLLGLELVTVLVSPDEALSFKILALNTEKAHNLRDRSREVIRMARELAVRHPRSREPDYALEFESPALLTLGLVYEQNGRFAGGAYHPFVRRVDKFSTKTLPASLREREGYAARLLEIDAEVVRIVEALKARGFRSPYLRNLVVARINPVRPRFGKEAPPPPPIGQALTRMAAAARGFDVARVRESDLALVAAMSAPPSEDEE